MSHEKTEKDEILLGDGISAWHNLGIVKPAGYIITLDEARRTVAPWEPQRVAVGAKVPDLELTTAQHDALVQLGLDPDLYGFETVPDKIGVRRPDTGDILGILTEDYGLFPNKAGFDLAAAILDEGDDRVPEVATAGTLRGGKLVWVLLKLNGRRDIHGDKFDSYLLVRWSHDGSTAVSVDVTCVRVVCKNTWNAAESAASRSWRAKHTGSVEERAKDARFTLKMADRYLDAFDAEVKQLVETVVSNDAFAEIVKAEFPIDDTLSKRAVKGREVKRERVESLWLNDTRVGQFHGTGWGAVQAFSTWEEHERRVVGNRAERRALRSISGSPLCDTVREKVLALNG